MSLEQDSWKSNRPPSPPVPSKLEKQQPFFGKPLIFIKLLQACCSVGDQQKAETSEPPRQYRRKRTTPAAPSTIPRALLNELNFTGGRPLCRHCLVVSLSRATPAPSPKGKTIGWKGKRERERRHEEEAAATSILETDQQQRKRSLPRVVPSD